MNPNTLARQVIETTDLVDPDDIADMVAQATPDEDPSVTLTTCIR